MSAAAHAPRPLEAAEGPSPAAPALSRRRALQLTAGVIGASAVVAVLAPPTLEPVAPAPTPPRRMPRFEPQLFTHDQALLVEELADAVIPETDSPGALRAGVPAFIEGVVREVYDEPERSIFLRGLDALNAGARSVHGCAFHECSPEARAALLAPLQAGLVASLPLGSLAEGAPFSFYKALRELCIEGFCQSKLGATRVLQYESVPGDYQGCVPLESVGRAWATS